MLKHTTIGLAILTVPMLAAAAEPVDLEMVGRIRAEGYGNSKVMETLAELTDVIGPRLTGSPQMKRANEWSRDRLAEWGLSAAHLESWGPFGMGWTFEHASAHMVSPQRATLLALPEAWTPGTDGPTRGKLARVELASEADLEEHRGKLAGAILLLEAPRELQARDQPQLKRYSDQELEKLAKYEPPSDRRAAWRDRMGKRIAFRKSLSRFLAEEGVVAVLSPSSRDGGTLRPTARGSWEKDGPRGVPSLVLAVEHYNRLARLVERELEVELEIDVRVTFYEDDLMAYNTVAEIPGSGRTPEVVMLGGHLDSWHAGTGATDNAAGCAVAMEAVRILQALGVKPKRTIRIALWSGEEQGLQGSRAYVARHFASRPDPEDPAEREKPRFLWSQAGRPLTLKPDHARLSAYFNLDNGTGRVRGVYLQENAAVAPIFEAWMEPLEDLGMSTLTMRNTGGTDHLAFDAVGLPGFQFIQDEVEYSTRTHHSNLDVYDRLQREDLVQASVVMASFVYHAAMREQRLPRKPLPKEEPSEAEPEEETPQRHEAAH